MIKNGGSYEIDSDWGSVNYLNSNSVTAHWIIPGGAPTGLYDLHIDATDGFGSPMMYILSNAFQVGCPISLSQTHQNTTCGNNNGSIDLTVTGGTAPYIYLWSNGATTQDLTNLSQGVYSVTVTDQTPCSQSISNIIIGNTNGPTTSETHLSSICGNSNGSINATIVGGTPPYNYLWNTGATTEDLSGLSAGSYLLTVTDINSCAGYISATISDSNDLAISLVSIPYNCSNQGLVVGIANSGTAPFSYLWNNGSVNDSLVNIPSGYYTVTITDAFGCTQAQTNFITSQYNFYVYVSPTNSNCSNNGSCSATVYNGVAPYQFNWSNGATTSTITGLASGNYSLTVTDNNGCTRSGVGTVTNTSNHVVEGYAFYDLNSNCIMDSTELPAIGATIHAAGAGGGYYATADSNGHYFLHSAISGTYTLDAWNGSGGTCNFYSACGNASSPINLSGNCDTISNCNFGFQIVSGFDLAVHPGWSSANPGFQKSMWIYYYYNSGNPFTDTATIVFHYDSALVYQYSQAPMPVHDAAAHTLTWQVSNFGQYCCHSYNYLRNYFLVPSTTPIGYQLTSEYFIDPVSGDCSPSNNHLIYTAPISGSLDPNEKEVTPEGDIMEGDSILTYTIHFQNTGNDTTNFIIVTDTLSQFLDPMSVENLASSHNYSDFNISGSGILTWTFNPIYLVDSATNEPES